MYKLIKVGGLWILWCKRIDEYFKLDAYSDENELYLKNTIITSDKDEVYDIEFHGKTLICVKLAGENKYYYLKKTSPSSWSIICKTYGVSTSLTELKGSKSVKFKEIILIADDKQYLVERLGNGGVFLKLIKKVIFIDRSRPEPIGDRIKTFSEVCIERQCTYLSSYE